MERYLGGTTRSHAEIDMEALGVHESCLRSLSWSSMFSRGRLDGCIVAETAVKVV